MLRGRFGLYWWMLVVALLAPLGYGVYRAFAGDDPLPDLASALIWPGPVLYVIAAGILWLGWNANLDQ